MPTEEENIQYLYLVLTNGGPPDIDWTSVAKALNLKNGATSKRWSRLKQAMEVGKDPGPSAYELLWLCVKHNSRDKALDWNVIAEKCGTTPGAASKRYSRMKQAFEKGDAAAATATKSKSGNPTSDGAKATPTSTPKRKRTMVTNGGSTKKKVLNGDTKYKPEGSEHGDDEDVDRELKRRRATPTPKARAKKAGIKQEQHTDNDLPLNNGSLQNHLPNPTLSGSVNPTEATTLIKTEPDEFLHDKHGFQGIADGYQGTDEDTEQTYYDAQAYTSGGEDGTMTQEIGLGVHEWLEEI